MAVRPVLIRRPPEEVWAVLCDGRRYAEWVVGTHASRPLDERWPQIGTAIAYVIRAGPWELRGRTVVRDHRPGRRLELEACTRALGSARISIEVRPWGEHALVTLDEHPLTGPGGRLHTVVSELVLQARHRCMTKRLAHVVENGARG
ncbi:SRPBCC family protein [Streptomyces sp. DSM 44917]|uniref:SRPBCC family protein n=1 Tax=Streptomyces boetiae TaxID=3075541 RepID=A0ABU2LBA1_9ACTN|nr:SRPBCC family protein [Streptomyces sp. DSM 44917]MDT0308855.1 SRPBCC family protein [Streptomyces sp. DSM 44917]